MSKEDALLVAVILGSKSDWDTMRPASDTLADFDIPHECRILSAHRTPEQLTDFILFELVLLRQCSPLYQVTYIIYVINFFAIKEPAPSPNPSGGSGGIRLSLCPPVFPAWQSEG